MRQFFTWGFWLSLLSLAGLTFLLLAVVREDPTIERVVAATAPPEHRIDMIGMVFAAQADPDFDIVDGVTTAALQIRIDGYRYLNIAPGTPGENRCAALDQLATCAVAADLLGESALWFSIVPLSPRNVVQLPPIVDLLDGGVAQLDNGWIVPHADVVKRVCEEDTVNLRDFIRRHGPDSTTQYSLDQQAIVSVTCGDGTTTAASTTQPLQVTPASTIAPVTPLPVTSPGVTVPITAPTAPITGAPTTIAP